MILIFSDTHLGFRGYSTVDDCGVSSAEYDCRISLEKIYEVACRDTITSIIFCGDFFHTNRPSTENIRWAIYWFLKMNSLKKPFYIIPGNHDASESSHSLVFLKELKLDTICLIEEPLLTFIDSIQFLFIPFITGGTSKNKYIPVYTALIEDLNKIDVTKPAVIVSHFHETHSKVGSEMRQVSKSVESIDVEKISEQKLYMILGHMHLSQSYMSGKTKIYYPGSTINMDSDDCNTIKGYLLLNSNLDDIKFEPLLGIRLFSEYTIANDTNTFEYFKNVRLSPNRVVFIKAPITNFIDSEELSKVLNERGCSLGKITYSDVIDSSAAIMNINSTKSNHDILRDYIKNQYGNNEKDWEQTLYPLGISYLSCEEN